MYKDEEKLIRGIAACASRRASRICSLPLKNMDIFARRSGKSGLSAIAETKQRAAADRASRSKAFSRAIGLPAALVSKDLLLSIFNCFSSPLLRSSYSVRTSRVNQPDDRAGVGPARPAKRL